MSFTITVSFNSLSIMNSFLVVPCCLLSESCLFFIQFSPWNWVLLWLICVCVASSYFQRHWNQFWIEELFLFWKWVFSNCSFCCVQCTAKGVMKSCFCISALSFWSQKWRACWISVTSPLPICWAPSAGLHSPLGGQPLLPALCHQHSCWGSICPLIQVIDG